MRRRYPVPLLAPLLLVPLLLAASGCGTGAADSAAASSSRSGGEGSPGSTLTSGSAPTTGTVPRDSGTPTTPPAQSPAQRVLAGMTLAQKAGQLLMVDCPSGGVSGAALAAIRDQQVGGIILDGNSLVGVSGTAAITAQLQQAAPTGVGLLISTDQEGGLVQRMRGPGFSSIPSGVQQGRMDPAVLRESARAWAGELKAAGINVNLAPVLDVVPPGVTNNPPIGNLDREYGSDPATVAAHGLAFAAGMHDAGVAPSVKHFPGLGRVAGNTDTTVGVLDTVTTADDPLLAPFAEAVRQGAPLVMMSTAIYTRIDPDRPAAFSPTVVTELLRKQFGFTGVVISDDVGAAKQVSGYSVAERAVAFVAAGGDIVLTVVPGQAATMAGALIARAQADPSFAALIDAAALRVLTLKQSLGLLR